MDVSCDCWYSGNKSRGKPPMALQFAQEQNCPSKWRCITLDVSSDVDKQSCYYLLRKYTCLLEEWSRMSGHLLVTEGVKARVIGIFWCGKKDLNGLRHFESMTP